MPSKPKKSIMRIPFIVLAELPRIRINVGRFPKNLVLEIKELAEKMQSSLLPRPNANFVAGPRKRLMTQLIGGAANGRKNKGNLVGDAGIEPATSPV